MTLARLISWHTPTKSQRYHLNGEYYVDVQLCQLYMKTEIIYQLKRMPLSPALGYVFSKEGAVLKLRISRKLYFSFFYCREESDPRYITSAANVKLRSFSTNLHSVEALVSYRAD